MQWVFLSGAAMLGAVVGSFLNVVAHRYHPDRGWDSIMGRSRCANPECRQPIPWYRNLPVLGWVLLGGKTACCGQRLSVRYPLVEALTALLFLGLAWAAPYGDPIRMVAQPPDPSGAVLLIPEWQGQALLAMVLQGAFLALLVVSSDIDLRFRILPDRLNLPGTAIGIMGAALCPALAGPLPELDLPPRLLSLLMSSVGAAAGAAFTYIVLVFGGKLFGKQAMGLGDVKFMAMIGAFTGWDGAFMAFFVGCASGALVGVVMKWLSGDSYIPFGPFLAIGGCASLLFRDGLTEFLFTTWPEWQHRMVRESPWIAVMVVVVCLLLLILLVRRGRAH